MKSFLVYLLLAAVSVEVLSSNEDIRKNELSTTSLEIPLIGKLLEILRKQDDFAMNLYNRMTPEKEHLGEVMREFSNEVINNIKGLNKSEECTEFGIKLVEIEHFNSRSKIIKCVEKTLKSVKLLNTTIIFGIYNLARKHRVRVFDFETEHLINEIYEYYNSEEIMKNLTADIVKDPFNCIYEILDDFNSTLSNSTMMINRCSEDNGTLIVSSITLQLTMLFDVVAGLSNYRAKFDTTLLTDSLSSINEGTEMDKNMSEAISVIKTISKNKNCSQSGIDQLLIKRLDSWIEGKKCVGEGIFNALRISGDITRSQIREIDEIICKFFNYANDLRNGIIISNQHYEMIHNISTKWIVSDELREKAERLTASSDCFKRNRKNFHSSINKIYARINKCGIRH